MIKPSVSVFVLGNSGSGKTMAVSVLQKQFQSLDLEPEIVSDRILLERAIVKDTDGGIVHPDGRVEGDHSFLIDGRLPEGRKKIHVKDGILLNTAHQEIITSAFAHNHEGGMIFEYALGPDVDFGDKEPLLQSGPSMVNWLQKQEQQPDRQIFLLEIKAGFEIRLARNTRLREDPLAEETFREYFPDGGEIYSQEKLIHLLGNRGFKYQMIDNNYWDGARFSEETTAFFTSSIRPYLDGRRPGRERL